MLRSFAARRTSIVAGLLVLGTSSPAWAGDRSASEASLAKDMLKEAIEDEKAGKCEEAIDVLKQVIAIQESGEAYLHLGVCIAKSGKLRDGLHLLEKAEDLARKEKDKPAQQMLISRMGELRDRIPTITIHLPDDVHHAAVTVDGQAVEAGDLARPIPVDPGDHVVEARAEGRNAFAQKLKLAEKETPLVEVTLAPIGSGAASGDAGGSIPLVTWIAGSAAVALAAGGVIAFAVAGSTASSGRDTCATQPSCDPTTVGSVRQLDATALGMWIGAGVGAATAVTFYFLEDRSKSTRKGSRAPRLLAGPGSLSLRGEF